MHPDQTEKLLSEEIECVCACFSYSVVYVTPVGIQHHVFGTLPVQLHNMICNLTMVAMHVCKQALICKKPS